MDSEEKVVRHLEMIQKVVNRIAHNSFLLKGWSMTLVVASIVLIARFDVENPYIILSFSVPVIFFWILDGYFLWQERLFRKVYNDVRVQKDTEFEMNVAKHFEKSKCNWILSVFSLTLNIFYIGQLLFVFLVFFITMQSNY